MTELFPPESVASLPGRLAQARIALAKTHARMDELILEARETRINHEYRKHLTEWCDLFDLQEEQKSLVARLEMEALG